MHTQIHTFTAMANGKESKEWREMENFVVFPTKKKHESAGKKRGTKIIFSLLKIPFFPFHFRLVHPFYLFCRHIYLVPPLLIENLNKILLLGFYIMKIRARNILFYLTSSFFFLLLRFPFSLLVLRLAAASTSFFEKNYRPELFNSFNVNGNNKRREFSCHK